MAVGLKGGKPCEVSHECSRGGNVRSALESVALNRAAETKFAMNRVVLFPNLNTEMCSATYKSVSANSC